MKRFFSLLLLIFSSPIWAGDFLPDSLRFQKDGSFSLHELKFDIAISDSRWRFVSNKNWKINSSQINRAGVKIDATVLPGSGKGNCSETVTALPDHAFEFQASLTMSETTKLNRVSGNFTLPADRCSIVVDGKAISIPSKPSDSIKLYQGTPKTLVLRTWGGEELVLSGTGSVLIQDNRKFKNDRGTISVMLLFSPSGGEFSLATLKFTGKLRNVGGQTLRLDSFVNRAFKETAGNRLPVWTLQGPEECLYMFSPGRLNALGVEFDVPAAGAVAVGAEARGVPSQITIPVESAGTPRSLNLLHTSAWKPSEEFGELEVKFADQSVSRFPISGLRDCADWAHRPENQENAVVAWTGNRPDNVVGIYLSTFPLPGQKKPIAVTFRTNNPKVIWFIMGITFSDEKIFLPGKDNRPSRIDAGKQWHKLVFHNQTTPGSPLDFSGNLDAPAGKYGFARPAPDGTLRFEKMPQKALRFYGTNLCQTANFPSRELAEKIADQLARNGYNSVRFHHHDNGLVAVNSPDSTTLNPENLDRLDYFIAALKKRGIYITTDLYASRQFKSGEGLKWKDPKAGFQSDPAAMQNWKTFVRNWLTHRNPYTGLTLAEEPALLMVNLVNEDDPLVFWNSSPESRARHLKLFEEWKSKNNCPNATADSGDRNFLDFLFALKDQSLVEMIRFVKDELKLQASVTSLNQHQALHFVALRDRFDVLDDHGYHDHRSRISINGKMTNGHSQGSAISGLSYMPRSMMTTRNPAKPFFMTEFNHCRPNRYRAEGGTMMGGYAALQNWTGIYRFCYSHSIKRIEQNSAAVSCFESVADPVMQLSDRMISAMFVRGDVKAADVCYSYAVPKNVLKTDTPLNFPLKFQLLGFITGIGSHIDGKNIPANTIALRGDVEENNLGKHAAAWRDFLETKRVTSATGELTYDAKAQTLVVTTARTESVTLPGGALSTGGVLSVGDVTGFATISAISLDGKRLADSGSILLLHLTDISNSGASFFDSDQRLVNQQGALPLLLRRGSAQISLKVAPGNQLKVHALSADGDDLGNVTVRNNSFTAATDLFPAGVMAYHITR